MFDLPTILKPNATDHDRALEQAIRKGKPDLTPIAKLMNPETCPAHLLGWLAWAFSVEEWDPEWGEEKKRDVIRQSIAVHRTKGTKGAIVRVLEPLGFAVKIEEWFEYGGAPHTFRVTAFNDVPVVAGFHIDPETYALLVRQIDAVKPVRSHMELAIGETFFTECPVAVALFDISSESLEHDVGFPSHSFETAIGMRTGHFPGADIFIHDITTGGAH